MQLDVLAIAAHPDDVELTCGGTLIKMAARGYRTGILDLTRGEMGTRGTPAIRAREAAAAAKIMGVKVRENAGLPDSKLEINEEYKLAIASFIRKLQPRTVILPYWEGRHPDHYNAGRLAYEGCFVAGLKQLPIDGGAFRPYKILYSTAYEESVRPTFAVDITAEYDRRRRAILAYKSQFAPKVKSKRSKVYIPLDQLESRMSIMASYYGRMIGVKYAEPFLTREIAAVDDIAKMPVRSI
jgi:N-acetylglucosamine malate deacetylase 1